MLFANYTDTQLSNIHSTLLTTIAKCKRGWLRPMLERFQQSRELLESVMRGRGIKVVDIRTSSTICQ